MKTSNKGWRLGIDSLGVAALITMTLATYALVVRPVLQAQQVQADRAVELSDAQARQSASRRSLARTTDNVSKIRSTVERTRVRLEPRTALNRRLAQIAQLAAEQGLQVDSVEPGEAMVNPRYLIVPIKLTGTGPFPRYGQFVGLIHESMPDVTVTAMNLSAVPGPARSIPRFEISLAWYAAPHGALAAQ